MINQCGVTLVFTAKLYICLLNYKKTHRYGTNKDYT